MRGWIGFAFIALLGLAAFLVWRDFETWRTLKGASAEIETDLRGWLEVNKNSLLQERDAFDTTRYDKAIAARTECAFLGGYLPPRQGKRPQVGRWAAPHRQLDQIAEADMRRQVAASFMEAAAQNPDTLSVGPSALDDRGQALFVRQASTEKREAADTHAFDGSIHVSVSAPDAATIIESGWGQAHPLAGQEKFPAGYVLLYAPRNEQDLEVAALILRAAIGHSGGYQCLNLSAAQRR